jgi:hypothetical protein
LLARSAQARDKAASLLTPQTRQAVTDAVRAASQRPWLLLGPPAAVLVVLGLRRRRRTRQGLALVALRPAAPSGTLEPVLGRTRRQRRRGDR